MHGGHELSTVPLDHLPALTRDPERWSEQGPRCNGSEHHDELRLDEGKLRDQPWPAGLDVNAVRCLVNAAFALVAKAKMLYGVGDVGCLAIDTGLVHRLVQQPPRRTDERNALAILLVAGRFTDQHDACVRVPCAEHSLGRVPVELATAAL